MDLAEKKEDTKDVSCPPPPPPRIRINITDKTPLLRMDAPSILRVEAPLETINRAIKRVDNSLENIGNTLKDIGKTGEKTDRKRPVSSKVYGPTLPPITSIRPPINVAVLTPANTEEPPTPSTEKIVTFPTQEATDKSTIHTPVPSPGQLEDCGEFSDTSSSSNTSADSTNEPTTEELFMDWLRMFVDDFAKDCDDVFERKILKQISKKRALQLLKRRIGGMRLMSKMLTSDSILEEMQDSYVPPRKKKARRPKPPTPEIPRPKSCKPSTKTN